MKAKSNTNTNSTTENGKGCKIDTQNIKDKYKSDKINGNLKNFNDEALLLARMPEIDLIRVSPNSEIIPVSQNRITVAISPLTIK